MKYGAKILLFNNSGNILVLRRSGSHPRYPQHLDLPGGEVEADESPLQAVRRELKEETGLILEPEMQIQKIHETVLHSNLTLILFKTALHTSDLSINLSWEHESYNWLSPAKLLSEPLPANADYFYEIVIKYITDNISTVS